jgi:isopenicillin N synthase-like dioxygenase
MFFESAPSLPSIALLTIDYDRLVHRDPVEADKLFKAAEELGFFYLKVNDQLDPAPMFTLAEKVFALPVKDKLQYVMDGKNGVYFGYKAAGSMYADRKGTPDSTEFWNISKDEMLLKNRIDYPQVILDAKETVKEYITKSHEIVLVILEILSTHLGLAPHTLPNLHRLKQSSGDQIRLTKSVMHPRDKPYSPDIALGAHTDFGSVTILFNRLSGLQVLAQNGEWLYVQPLAGHAIVNLGDAMVKLTGGRLNSNIHRVVTTPDLQELTDRYSIVYFSRPENHVQMKSLINDDEQQDEHVLTAQEWIANRVRNLQTENYQNEETYAMSRGTEGCRENATPV